MATETKYSTFITNRDATPRVPVDLRQSGRRFSRYAVITPTVGVTLGAIYVMFPLPSNCVVTSMEISSTQFSATGTFHVGLYQTTLNGAAVLDADYFKASVDCHTAALSKSEIVNGNVITVALAEKMLWQGSSLTSTYTSDPQIDFDVCLTSTDTIPAGTGNIFLECHYKMV